MITSMIPDQAQPIYQQAPIVQQPVIQQPIIQPVMQPQVVQQQPQVVQHTTIIEKTVEKEAEKPVTKQPGKWSHDICGCFEDTETLLLVAFCPCSAAGEFFNLVAVIFTKNCCKNRKNRCIADFEPYF